MTLPCQACIPLPGDLQIPTSSLFIGGNLLFTDTFFIGCIKYLNFKAD